MNVRLWLLVGTTMCCQGYAGISMSHFVPICSGQYEKPNKTPFFPQVFNGAVGDSVSLPTTMNSIQKLCLLAQILASFSRSRNSSGN